MRSLIVAAVSVVIPTAAVAGPPVPTGPQPGVAGPNISPPPITVELVGESRKSCADAIASVDTAAEAAKYKTRFQAKSVAVTNHCAKDGDWFYSHWTFKVQQ